MNKIQEFAVRHGIDENLLNAVIAVEAGGNGFNEDGSLKIRFEVHLLLDDYPSMNRWFKLGNIRFLDHFMCFPSYSSLWRKVHTGNQWDEFNALLIACHGVGQIAWGYASFGAGQILSKFHYEKLGFSSPIAMYSYMSQSRENDIEVWLRLLEVTPSFLLPLKNKDLRQFAVNYNGNGQVDYYVRRFIEELNKQ